MIRTSLLAWAAAAAAAAFAAQPVAVPPFTFVGRVMDSTHAAFDTNRVATVDASDASGATLARATTFFRPDSRRNYSLQIPMATEAVTGYSVAAAQLTLRVTDNERRVWEGVVPLSKSVVGEPGGVRELDIVLCEDADGDGIDDSLRASLYYDWLFGPAYDPAAEPFDPRADHDGDGVATLDEAYAGTDPFDRSDRLRVTRWLCERSTGGSLSFTASGGRSYVVETAVDLADDAPWTSVPFLPEDPADDAGTRTVLSIPSSVRSAAPTVWLLPVETPPAGPRFFRVRLAE